MDLRKLKTLIDLVQNSGISELEISEGEEKIRIAKHLTAMPATTMVSLPPGPAPMTMATPAAAPAPAAAAEAAPAQPDGHAMKAPMVGTFYRSATPGGKAIVEVGDDIVEGQPVCIIEAMKIMNEIEADVAGRIVRILVENGLAVEFGQPLFVVE